jgi:hypothetical protein
LPGGGGLARSRRRPTTGRRCQRCGAPAYIRQVDATGAQHGWLCDRCDRKSRRKRMGWKRRAQYRLRHLLRL